MLSLVFKISKMISVSFHSFLSLVKLKRLSKTCQEILLPGTNSVIFILQKWTSW